MVAGLEMSRLLAAFKYMSGTIYTRIDSRHHEATVGAQTAFFENVKIMTTVLQDMGNPFQDESSDLLLDCSSSRCSFVLLTMKNARSIFQLKKLNCFL